MAYPETNLDPFSTMTDYELTDIIARAQKTLASRFLVNGAELMPNVGAKLQALGEVACPMVTELVIDQAKLATDNERVRLEYGNNVRKLTVLGDDTLEMGGTQIALSTDKTSDTARLARQRLLVFFINRRGQAVWHDEIAEGAGIAPGLLQTTLKVLNRRSSYATGKLMITQRRYTGGKRYMYSLADDIVVNDDRPSF